MPTTDLLAALTPTERHTLGILSREGPKAAPELGRRMRKSREHMARLMKKLYLEGYVDSESNHPPFRYKLSEKIELFLNLTRGRLLRKHRRRLESVRPVSWRAFSL